MYIRGCTLDKTVIILCSYSQVFGESIGCRRCPARCFVSLPQTKRRCGGKVGLRGGSSCTQPAPTLSTYEAWLPLWLFEKEPSWTTMVIKLRKLRLILVRWC